MAWYSVVARWLLLIDSLQSQQLPQAKPYKAESPRVPGHTWRSINFKSNLYLACTFLWTTSLWWKNCNGRHFKATFSREHNDMCRNWCVIWSCQVSNVKLKITPQGFLFWFASQKARGYLVLPLIHLKTWMSIPTLKRGNELGKTPFNQFQCLFLVTFPFFMQCFGARITMEFQRSLFSKKNNNFLASVQTEDQRLLACPSCVLPCPQEMTPTFSQGTSRTQSHGQNAWRSSQVLRLRKYLSRDVIVDLIRYKLCVDRRNYWLLCVSSPEAKLLTFRVFLMQKSHLLCLVAPQQTPGTFYTKTIHRIQSVAREEKRSKWDHSQVCLFLTALNLISTWQFCFWLLWSGQAHSRKGTVTALMVLGPRRRRISPPESDAPEKQQILPALEGNNREKSKTKWSRCLSFQVVRDWLTCTKSKEEAAARLRLQELVDAQRHPAVPLVDELLPEVVVDVLRDAQVRRRERRVHQVRHLR